MITPRLFISMVFVLLFGAGFYLLNFESVGAGVVINPVVQGEGDKDQNTEEPKLNNRKVSISNKERSSESLLMPLKLTDAIEGAELRYIEAETFSSFDVNDYVDPPLTPEAAYQLFSAKNFCRIQSDSVASSFCEEIYSLSLPSEFDSLKMAAEGGHLEAILEFSNFISPDFESWNQSEIDAIRSARIEMLGEAWSAGSIEALHELSASYFNGLGVEIDLNEAYYYSKTAQVIYDEFDGELPLAFVDENKKIMSYLEATLYPYQREPIVVRVDSQKIANCCIIFSPTK